LEILEIIVVNTNFTFTIAMGCDTVFQNPSPQVSLRNGSFSFWVLLYAHDGIKMKWIHPTELEPWNKQIIVEC
jgi:hypothetical protein